MRDPFVFDSRSEFCKKPFGAVPCGSDVVFHVRPLTRDGYSRCVLVARREFSGEEIQMELLPEAVDGERTRFTGVLTAPSEPERKPEQAVLLSSHGLQGASNRRATL